METDAVEAGLPINIEDSDPTYEAWKRYYLAYVEIWEVRIPILPMRHGNGYTRKPIAILNGNSDPTYEAWKRNRMRYFRFSKEYSDPTYEAWKRNL